MKNLCVRGFCGVSWAADLGTVSFIWRYHGERASALTVATKEESEQKEGRGRKSAALKMTDREGE